MTESRVETLLQQMSLAKPSTALDDKVIATVDQVESAMPARPEPQAVWKPLTAVAIACLLIGIAVGRATASRAVAAEMTNVAANQTSDGAPDKSWNPEIRSANDVIVNDDGGQSVFAKVEGPRVAILCAQDAAAAKEKRCSKCHSGVTEEPDFRSGVVYVHNLHQQLCAKCHTTMEGMIPEDIKDAVLDQPWHKENEERLPTG